MDYGGGEREEWEMVRVSMRKYVVANSLYGEQGKIPSVDDQLKLRPQ